MIAFAPSSRQSRAHRTAAATPAPSTPGVPALPRSAGGPRRRPWPATPSRSPTQRQHGATTTPCSTAHGSSRNPCSSPGEADAARSRSLDVKTANGRGLTAAAHPHTADRSAHQRAANVRPRPRRYLPSTLGALQAPSDGPPARQSWGGSSRPLQGMVMPSTRTIEETREATPSYTLTRTHPHVVNHGVAQQRIRVPCGTLL